MAVYDLADKLPKAKANQFKNKKIFTNIDLLDYIPHKYYDYREVVDIYTGLNKCNNGEDSVAVIGKIVAIKKNIQKGFFFLSCVDQNNNPFTAFYFNQIYRINDFKIGEEWFMAGKVGQNDTNFPPSIIPTMESKDLNEYRRIIPAYRKVRKMSDEYLLKAIDTVLEDKIDEHLDKQTMDIFKLVNKQNAYSYLHKPSSIDQIKLGYKRYVFDRLYDSALYTLNNSSIENAQKMTDKTSLNIFLKSIPFELTDDQKSAIVDATDKMERERLNCLIQGDVGCGKTIVALAIMSVVISNNSQAVLVAPTETLAKQHLEDAIKYFGEDNVAFLSGSQKTKEKNKNLNKIKYGCPIIIGTHSLLQESVVYRRVSIALFDEQHKFGVEQKKMLTNRESNGEYPHFVSLTATPIPRSLAISIYTDSLCVYDIKTKPSGRKPIITTLSKSDEESNFKILSEIKKGHQAYVVCPLIEKSKSKSIENVKSVEEVYIDLVKSFQTLDKSVKIAYISGDMKQEAINEVINDFKDKKYDILISTTIIEVGVNVPNTTIMLIKSSDRFGLATLHQLRGRVGRSSLQSYTILQPDNPNDRKSDILTKESDGYNIAMLDLQNRGSGTLAGTEQSGHNGDLDFIYKHNKFYKKIQKYVMLRKEGKL